MRIQLPVVLILFGVVSPLFADEPPKRREHPRYGWNTESEAAVASGLAWLTRKQQKNGSWEFDGSSKDKVAATSMALLPFLAANQTPANGKYKDQVTLGIGWLTSKVNATGSIGTNDMYAHALATMALCEAAWRTKDAKIKEKAKAAAAYIVGAQGRNGSWGYTGPAPSEGDTSIVGMQIEALTAAKRAGIEFDAKVFEKADKFLVSVSSEIESKYGYREKGMSQTLTPVALLSRNAMGTISDVAYGRGIEFLKQFPPQKGYFDTYYYYYATQVVFQAGGDYWHKFWNPKVRDLLISLHNKDDKLKAKAELAVEYIVKAQGKNGSWGYTGPAPSEGDTSIVGWQVQALAAAKTAGIKFDKNKVYKGVNDFLVSVSKDNGANYGYREPGVSMTLTPVGILSRYSMGEMNPRHPAYGRSVDYLKQYPPQKGYFDMYYYYYATRVFHFYEGPDWHKFWNPKMRDMLIDLQHKKKDDATFGSWKKDEGFIGTACGRLGTTALAVLTLEVYYRDIHLYKRDNGGLAELEK